MNTGASGYREQSPSLRTARAHLQTLSEGDHASLVAAAALSSIDGTIPSYPPAETLADGGSFELARPLIQDAIQASDNMLEIGRLGDALDLLVLYPNA